MGTFGFFMFLAAVAVSANWRAVRTLQLQRDMLTQALASGQAVDFDKLARLLIPPPRPLAGARWKIGTLLVLSTGSFALSWAYWEAGTMPLVIAGLFALAVAGITWRHVREFDTAGMNRI